jgi:hypothetical protein
VPLGGCAMKKFSNTQLSIITEQIWRNIDRIFSNDVKKFLESMSKSDRVDYYLCKRQIVHSLLNWWKQEGYKPLCFQPDKAIYRTKEQVYSGFLENVDNNKNYKEKLLECALLNMLVVPNILQLTENSTVKNRYKKSELHIKFIRATIKDCVNGALKYSDINK